MTSPFFDHDDDPDEFVNLELSDLGCTYCIGGFAPAGTHPILGLVYVACVHCTDPCDCCGAVGLYPADSNCIQCLIEALKAVGHTATFCHTCVGILAVERADTPTNTPDDDPPWEVTS
jgi:hypothetical protein